MHRPRLPSDDSNGTRQEAVEQPRHTIVGRSDMRTKGLADTGHGAPARAARRHRAPAPRRGHRRCRGERGPGGRRRDRRRRPPAWRLRRRPRTRPPSRRRPRRARATCRAPHRARRAVPLRPAPVHCPTRAPVLRHAPASGRAAPRRPAHRRGRVRSGLGAPAASAAFDLRDHRCLHRLCLLTFGLQPVDLGRQPVALGHDQLEPGHGPSAPSRLVRRPCASNASRLALRPPRWRQPSLHQSPPR